MKVLLINTFWKIKNQHNIWKKIAGLTPPIGLLSIAAYLEENNIKVDLLEANDPNFYMESVTSDYLSKYDYIGISSTTNIINNAYHIIDKIKDVSPTARIIVGGIHATIRPEEIINQKNVDYVITGEGEIPLLKLLTEADISKVPNLYYKKPAGGFGHTEISCEPTDVNSLPIPAYDKIKFSNYYLTKGSYKRKPNIGIIVSRGCPSLCTFCNGPLFGRKVRIRTVDNIMKEIKLLINHYGIKEISFYDDNLTIYKEHILELCNRIVEDKLDLTWSCFSKVNFMNETILKALKKAGCHQIMYGVESGDSEILKTIKKNIKLDKVKKVVKLTQKYGIDARATFMIGSPGETEESIMRTINYAINLNPDRALFNITTPFPGTEMYRWAVKNDLLLSTDWSDYDLSRPLMKLPTISNEKILHYYSLAYRKFYFRLNFIIRQIVTPRNWHNLWSNFLIAFKLLYYIIKK